MQSKKLAYPIPVFEFVSLMAMMMALVALSIDSLLPALPEIAVSLDKAGSNDIQLIISMLFLGLAVGQMVYGTLSDFIGRKPAVYLGLLLFFLGCLVSFFAEILPMMLAGRLLQGIGLAAPRIISIALIRDQYEGAVMAKVMSFVMSIFIIVPAIAPALGQGVLFFANWRFIFLLLSIVAVIILVWFMFRQPETLEAEKRMPFSFGRIFKVISQICGNRVALGYTIVAGFVSSIFLGFLSSIQQIFEAYGEAEIFAGGFAAIALFIGSASLLNAKIVMLKGMRYIVKVALGMLFIVSLTYLMLSTFDHLDFWVVMVFFVISLFCVGLLFGNLNALAMEPLGHVAGIGSSLVGSLSTFISVPFGILIGLSFNGTAIPLIAGFLVFSLLSLGMIFWIGKAGKG
ncbi:multidrug effflux MFS transporter [Fulvivirga sp. 29W222]|uniref:Multidrug effflux MFS transporter n=1 Tax=Fulvivirga marina TaxID=2494733 RepID=A0A937FWU9_9BACT|nr:multidrug effflux MFS transporter [Fulvivirga marina]MBL6445988.1 multidrug effflux MFS transporter [Fulvivirga marina]